MEQSLSDTFYDTLSDVFEKMYFTVLEPLPGPPAPASQEEEYLEAAIAFRGEKSGTFRLLLPQPLARHITVNFLGLENEDVAPGQILDTIKETANMTGGSLLGKLDPQGKCILGIPESRQLAGFLPPDSNGQVGLYAFESDFGLLWLLHESH